MMLRITFVLLSVDVIEQSLYYVIDDVIDVIEDVIGDVIGMLLSDAIK